MGRQLLPPLLPEIIDDFAITSTQAGFALTMMWGLYALGQYPSGRWSDNLSRKTLLVISLGLLSIGFLVVWQSVSYHLFLIGVGVIGLGSSLYPTVARALVSDLFVTRRGQAFGWHTASGDIGNVTAAGLAVAAIAVASWHTVFLPTAVAFGLTLLLLHIWSHEGYSIEKTDLRLQSTVRQVFTNRRLVSILVAYALFAFTWQSTTGFLPLYLQDVKGFSVSLASFGFALVFIIGMMVKPFSGFLGDHVGHLRVAAGALLLGAIGLVCILIFERSILTFLSIGVFAAGLMSFPPVIQTFLMNLFPDESMGGDLGAMRTVYLGLGSVGPTYVGFVAGVSGYSVAFVGLVLCLTLSCILLLVVHRY